MGFGLILVSVITLAAGLYMASMMRGRQTQQTNMSPNTMEAFSVTSCSEGEVIPLIFGYARITGNILFYGNLKVTEITEEVETGKGGGSDTETITVGYKYYMDIWESLCVGAQGAEITAIYENDKNNIGLEYTLFNDGTQSTFPTVAGEYASPLNPIMHVYWHNKYIGDNVSFLPTYHFVVHVPCSNLISNANFDDNTVNPAAVILQLLLSAGEQAGNIVLSSFQEAGEYWYSKGYGITLVQNKQEELRDVIQRVFTCVDGNLREDNYGRTELKAWMDTDTAVANLTSEDFKTFTFQRKAWDKVYSDFRANYTDAQKRFTTRTLTVRNSAVISLVGSANPMSIDLTMFCYRSIASKRLWELAKRLSYPEANISCTVSTKFQNVRVGDVINIENSDYGIASMDFRVVAIDISKYDSNEIKWELTEKTEGVLDNEFYDAGETLYEDPADEEPLAPLAQAIFKIPRGVLQSKYAAYENAPLLLCARAGNEKGFYFAKSSSITASTFEIFAPGGKNKIFTRFSQVGHIEVEYSSDTYSIDDEIGIIYTPTRDDIEFTSISRGQLFDLHQICIINNELMAFQNVEALEDGSYKLTGILRGLGHTAKATHALGSTIWLTKPGAGNIAIDVNPYFVKDSFGFTTALSYDFTYFQFLPIVSGSYFEPVNTNRQISSFTFDSNYNKWIHNIRVERAADDLAVTVYPYLIAKEDSIGKISGDLYYPSDTMEPWSKFCSLYYRINGGSSVEVKHYEEPSVYDKDGVEITTDAIKDFYRFTYTNASAHTLEVMGRRWSYANKSGKYSSSGWVSISVSATEGEVNYKNTFTEANFLELPFESAIDLTYLNHNAEELNDKYLWITNLFDVNDTSIADTNILVWDAATQKFVPGLWPSTTTTTSSSTTSSSTSSSTTSSTITGTTITGSTTTTSLTGSTTTTITSTDTTSTTITFTGSTTTITYTNTTTSTSTSSSTTTSTFTETITTTDTITTTTVAPSTGNDFDDIYKGQPFVDNLNIGENDFDDIYKGQPSN